MAQRQFRSDDTSVYSTRYGNSSNGTKLFNTSITVSGTDGYYNGTLTGSSGSFSGPTDLANGTYNLPCKIVQSQGTGANIYPNFEFNYLTTVSSGTANFQYPFTITFSTGAQFVTSFQWSSISFSGSPTISPPAWNGTKGGELFFCATSTFDISGGTISLAGLGFRAGTGINGTNTYAQTGEGYPGPAFSVNTPGTINGNGGGLAFCLNGTDRFGGGGGANGLSGSAGGGSGSGQVGSGGAGAGNPGLTIMQMGGGGGGGAGGAGAGNGGYGGANFTLLAPIIKGTGSIILDGGNAQTIGANLPGGGGAGAGSGLFKGQVINLSSMTITALGGAGGSPGSGSVGGVGSVGRFHIDYSGSVTGASNPVADVRIDSVLQNSGFLIVI